MIDRKNLFLIASAGVLLAHGLAFAQSGKSFETHCKAPEVSILDAKMGNMQSSGSGSKLVKNGKLVSLCADRAQEPFHRLAYRYGRPGQVEFEQIATPSSKFGIYSGETAPRVGEQVISFSKYDFDYYVAESSGMGSGISVVVFKSGKKIADLFSGYENGVDFQSSLLDISSDKPASPIFEFRKPKRDYLTMR